MANLENIISAKTENDETWKQQRQAERENTVAMRDGGITHITSDPEMYSRYLMLQGDNPAYSAGNIVLCLYQLKDASIIGTKERWKSLGRHVLDSERDKGAKIFVRPSGPNARGYNLGDAYDISQTQGRSIQSIKLENDTPQMEKALATLLNYSPVPVVADRELDGAALYDEENLELVVNPEHDDGTAFAAISAEIAHARLHNKGQNAYYDRGESALDAESISYLLCRRFGVDRQLPDASAVAALNDGLSVESRTEALNHVQDMAKQIGGSIDRQICPPQQTQSRSARPAR